MKEIFFLLIFIQEIFCDINRHFCYNLTKESRDELELQNKIERYFSQMKDDSPYCIEHLLKTSNYKALETYVVLLNEAGIKFRETLSNSINSIEKQLTEIYNKYKYKKNDYQRVLPAVQWAQNMSDIFLEVKFSHRHDSPGCLEVDNLNINIKKNKLYLSAECVLGEIPIIFEINFTCLYELDESASSHKPGSVGRHQLRIRKKKNRYWERLLLNESDTPSNMRIWFEMKNKYGEEMKKYEKEKEIDDNDKSFEDLEREYREKRKKEKEERKKNKKDKKDKKDKKAEKDKKQEKDNKQEDKKPETDKKSEENKKDVNKGDL